MTRPASGVFQSTFSIDWYDKVIMTIAYKRARGKAGATERRDADARGAGCPLLLGDAEDLVRARDDVQLAVGVLPERQPVAHARAVPVAPLDRLADRQAEAATEARAAVGVNT